MNIHKIRNDVAAIKAASGDYEAQHGMEDDLFSEFIHYVAEGEYGDLAEMAREVLKTQYIDFARHCA